MVRAAFTHSNSHYVFPPISFADQGTDILSSINQTIHTMPFNETLVREALVEAATTKTHPSVLELHSIKFSTLNAFKIGLNNIA